MVGRNRNSVRNLVNKIQFFNRDLIDFVEYIDGGNIDTARKKSVSMSNR